MVNRILTSGAVTAALTAVVAMLLAVPSSTATTANPPGAAPGTAASRAGDTRDRDLPPFAAGMRVYAYGVADGLDKLNQCTGGPMFSIDDEAPVMLVAGHCQGRFEDVLGGFVDSTGFHPTSEVGDFSRNLFRGPKTRRDPAIDVAMIRLYQPEYGGRELFTGAASFDSTLLTIARTERPRLGREYCISGAVTGAICGFKAKKREHTRKIGGGKDAYFSGRLWELKKDVKDSDPTGCTDNGDSGAPVYRVKNGQARVIGIHVAGRCTRSLGIDDSAFSYVVPLYVAADELDQTFRLP